MVISPAYSISLYRSIGEFKKLPSHRMAEVSSLRFDIKRRKKKGNFILDSVCEYKYVIYDDNGNNNDDDNSNNNSNNETGSWSPCMRPRSDPPKKKNSNVVRSRLIIFINEEINEANWMVSNSAKLDRRTKQHTQFGVSASNGSRDMTRTKSWRKK